MSAILSSEALNDFISPGVACIKPIETLPKVQAESNPDEVITDSKSSTNDVPPAQISLTDCLACSGCVTSAEAVLVSLQSHAEVLRALNSTPALKLSYNADVDEVRVSETDPEGRLYVASVSPQSRASIAAAYGVTEKTAGIMIQRLLSGPEGLRSGGTFGNGFDWVLDTNAARDMTLVAGAGEVLASLGSESPASLSGGTISTRSTAVKPVLTSSCPGWICYAEKTHPHVLSHLSRLKSPQALLGTLVKTTLSRKLGISPERIWHVAVMPCFDKKLEASREELTDAAWYDKSKTKEAVRDVDCVITSKELLMLADSRGIDFASMDQVPLLSSHNVPFPDSTLRDFLFPVSPRQNSSPASGTSGGNLYYILRYIASQHPGSSIRSVRGRNADIVEYSVISAAGGSLINAARYYGFRNIQNLVRRLKPVKPFKMQGVQTKAGGRKPSENRGGLDFAYVEVMACPGGCTNGGGQIKVSDSVKTPELKDQKQWLAAVDEAYFSAEETDRDSGVYVDLKAGDDTVDDISPSYVQDLMKHWSSITGIELETLMYTSYRAVVSDVGKLANDTQRVVDLASKMGGGW